jgi:hypothetical protein
MNQPLPGYSAPPPDSKVKTAVAGGALAALLIAVIYLFVQVNGLKNDAAKRSEAMDAKLEALKENSAMLASNSRQHMDSLHDELDAKAQRAFMASRQAKSEALARIEQSKKQLQAEQQANTEKVTGELSAVKNDANAKIADVSGDVSNVKTQVASTRSELEKTIGDLKKVTGDLGVTSGYVATNGKELAALRRLGERDYTEFTLSKSAKAGQRVGDVMLTLKKADPKRNRFTLEVFADDKKTEKKDRTVNEPVQFYVAKARQPYEIVVNEVKKDVIVGYLAKPKDQIAR